MGGKRRKDDEDDDENPPAPRRRADEGGEKRRNREEGLSEDFKASRKVDAGEGAEDGEDDKPKEQPNYGLSGALAAEGNTFKGVLLKYSEPPEARKPTKHFRLYVFKGKDQIDMLQIHRQSAYLLGRDRIVADIPIDHPSCSKQHAVLQYRHVTNDDGVKVIKPYIIDLESSNGTFINTEKIQPTRYYELKIGDTLKFGMSSRDYVMMAEEVISSKKSG
ncbi:Smad nuclear-interacting protein 1 [Phlyctochytrium planicorne]|nr:Smad nuclear-interacting protein 1 [Phlyctochytrium planicorne]